MFMNVKNELIFESKLKNNKLNTCYKVINYMIITALLTEDPVYAKSLVNESNPVWDFLYTYGPPIVLTSAEIFKNRFYIKLYIENIVKFHKKDT